jgi:hypothetical protein
MNLRTDPNPVLHPFFPNETRDPQYSHILQTRRANVAGLRRSMR